MSDKDVLDRARLLFVGDTQGDKLAREVIAIAERLADTEAIRKAGDELREEMESTSEECMCAGWLYSLEHVLWDAIESGRPWTAPNGTENVESWELVASILFEILAIGEPCRQLASSSSFNLFKFRG